MRIISGTARGTKLYSLEGLETRPTLDRVKEPLFSIITPHINDAKVLDLFAGSGALGLEALSRGANYATFGENSKTAVQIVKRNIEKTHMQSKAQIIEGDYLDVLHQLSKQKSKFNIIFLDPPYRSGYDLIALENIISNKLITQDGIIIIETDEDEKIESIKKLDTINIEDIRKYGRVRLIIAKGVN